MPEKNILKIPPSDGFSPMFFRAVHVLARQAGVSVKTAPRRDFSREFHGLEKNDGGRLADRFSPSRRRW